MRKGGGLFYSATIHSLAVNGDCCGKVIEEWKVGEEVRGKPQKSTR